MITTIDALTRYPVKGLSGQSLDQVRLKARCGFPCDRQFGFARPNSGFDTADPKPLPKTKFYMLARDSRLSLLDTSFDESSGMLTISSDGTDQRFNIATVDGKRDASEFIKSFLDLPDDEAPQLFEASPHRFTDVAVVSSEMMNAVSLINLESVATFSKAVGQDVDAKRFRGNILVSGLPAFTELDQIGQTIAIGAVRLKVVMRTKRCPATEVDLQTGQRNIKVPRLLSQNYGHMDMGVYCEVIEGGKICTGDVVEFLSGDAG